MKPSFIPGWATLALTALLCPVALAAPRPPQVQKVLVDSQLQRERIEAEWFQQASGLNYTREMEFIHGLRRKPATSATLSELKQAVAKYRELARELDKQARKLKRWQGTAGAYRLYCAANEALQEKTPSQRVPASEWLQYAEALSRFDHTLNAAKRAAAYQEVLLDNPTRNEELAALRGRQNALIVADQSEPGKYSAEILAVVDRLRASDPKGTHLRDALIATGDHFRSLGQKADARRYYEECIDQYRGRAHAAELRLQQL